MKITRDEIEAARSKRGGWTKETLAGWGISWPPPKGWQAMLLTEGYEPETEPNAPESNPHCLEAKILQEVLLAVVNSGQGDILAGIEALNAYHGELPTVADIVGGRPERAVLEGGLTWDDKVFRFSVARTVSKSNSVKPQENSELTEKERSFLSLINPEGTIGVGTSVGAQLFHRGYVTKVISERYAITESGKLALEIESDV